MFYTVYKTTNTINGKIYIGVHKTENLDDDYIGSGKVLKYAINKYGIENFSKEILATFDNPEDMFEMESELVNEDFVNDKSNYNLKEGGIGGWDHFDNKGTVVVRDNKGDYSRVTTSDPRYISGELVPTQTGSVIVKDKDGKQFYVKTDDPRYISGELVFILKGKGDWTGKRHTEETKQKIGKANSKLQSGKGNSNYGNCWIYCPYTHENKTIPRFDLTKWEKDGWIKGRKCKRI